MFLWHQAFSEALAYLLCRVVMEKPMLRFVKNIQHIGESNPHPNSLYSLYISINFLPISCELTRIFQNLKNILLVWNKLFNIQ